MLSLCLVDLGCIDKKGLQLVSVRARSGRWVAFRFLEFEEAWKCCRCLRAGAIGAAAMERKSGSGVSLPLPDLVVLMLQTQSHQPARIVWSRLFLVHGFVSVSGEATISGSRSCRGNVLNTKKTNAK